jgi:hypothetical protein
MKPYIPIILLATQIAYAAVLEGDESVESLSATITARALTFYLLKQWRHWSRKTEHVPSWCRIIYFCRLFRRKGG